MQSRLRTRLGAALLATTLFAISGCSGALVGTWKTAEDPPDNPNFFIRALDFRKDGTVHVSAKDQSDNLFLRGKYSFNGMRLTLKPDNQEERSYAATLWWGSDLKLTADNRTQTLKRQ